jgi:type VI secretion system protein ImpH
VLPSYYHRLVRRRLRARDRVFRDFLDLINHRAISLFYRAWVKYRFPIAYERTHRVVHGAETLTSPSALNPPSPATECPPTAAPAKSSSQARFETGSETPCRRPNDDDFSRSLLALVGLGTGGQRDRYECLEPAMLAFAGLFSHLPRSAVGLERILVEHFQLPIQVLQFQGQWLTIDASDRSRLGGSHRTSNPNNRLGQNALLGDGVWDIQSRFRLRIGPLESPSRFYRFLPVATDGELRRIQRLTRVYVGPELEFDIQLVLPGGASLEVELGGDQERSPLLGWNVWLRTAPFESDNGDAVFPDEVIERPSS